LKKLTAITYTDSACTNRRPPTLTRHEVVNSCELTPHNGQVYSRRYTLVNNQVAQEYYNSKDCTGSPVDSLKKVIGGSVGGTTCVPDEFATYYMKDWTVTDLTDMDYAWSDVFSDSGCTQSMAGVVNQYNTLLGSRCEAVTGASIPATLPQTTKSFATFCNAGNIMYASFDSTDCSGAHTALVNHLDCCASTGETRGGCRKLYVDAQVFYQSERKCSATATPPPQYASHVNSANGLGLTSTALLLVWTALGQA